MPYSRRTGKRYAAGSQTTFGGWEPRICCLCGLPVVKSHQPALRFDYDHVAGTARSWHVACEKTHGWPVAA